MVCRLGEARRAEDPCTVVIFGATGDLTGRKLIPALYHLCREGLIRGELNVIGFARRDKNTDLWREELREALGKYSRTRDQKENAWSSFSERLIYVRGDIAQEPDYRALKEAIIQCCGQKKLGNVLYYLAIPPSQFAQVAASLENAGMLSESPESGWKRLIVEKPFGHDLESARLLNRELTRHAREDQIFRIDHYLGKETVQNIMLFRFSNAIFERLWNRDSVEHVQITVSEKMGVGSRGGYYEEAGALRDMVQNHLLQVLSLVAMEPPVSLDPEPIRDEKVKLLRSIRLIQGQDVFRDVVRGQYVTGDVNGDPRHAYRQEERVRPDSNVETFVALRAFVDNWRWSGVPFYLRTGKNLPLSASEVRVQFRRSPHVLFAAQCGVRLDQNSLTIRLQPEEGITLHFNGKVPGALMELRPVRMHFSYNAEFGAYTPEAYERLLLDAMVGDATLFIRRDEVEAAWRFVDEIRAAWADQPLRDVEFYSAGSWGPAIAEELLKRDGANWREPLANWGARK